MILASSERDSVKAADWLEAEIVYSGRQSVPLEALRSQITLEGEFEDTEDQSDHGQDTVDDFPSGPGERFTSNAASEIQRRSSICGEGYPFVLNSGRLEWAQKRSWADPYIVCLLAADRQLYRHGDDTAQVFEHLSTLAIGSFLGGKAIRFGARRDTFPGPIGEAIALLGQLTFSKQINGWNTYHTDQDFGLDVVGWKPFPDGYNNQLQIYMQCATGEGWLEEKKGEPNLDIWRGLLLWGTPPLVALSIPYVVNDEERWQRNLAGRLVLDRLRITYALAKVPLNDDQINWTDWVQNRVALARSMRSGDIETS